MERELTLTGGDLLYCDLGGVSVGDRGQVLECSLRLEGVLPERRVAVAVAVDERAGDGGSYPRGLRVLTVPAHHGAQARDVTVTGLRFILPGDLDLGEAARTLTVRADAHYVDRHEACLLSE